MAVFQGLKDMTNAAIGNKELAAIKLGSRLIWEADTYEYDLKIPYPESGEFDILYTADIHVGWKGWGSNRFGTKVFSLDTDQLTNTSLVGGDVKAYQNKLAAAHIPSILLDCGDWSKTSDISATSYTNTVINTMKGMNYFGITSGNWEFKWDPIDTAYSYMNQLNGYGMMACNINNASNNPIYVGGVNPSLPGCKTIKVGSKKIGIIGVGYPSPNGFATYGNVTEGGNIEWNPGAARWNYKQTAGDPDSTTRYRWPDSIADASAQQNRTVRNDISLYGIINDYTRILKNTYKFDYVIVFGHMDRYTDENYSADNRFYSRADFLIMNTTGVDVFIPGHLNSSVYGITTCNWRDGSGSGIVAPEAAGTLKSFGRLKIDLTNGNITCKLLDRLSHLNCININDITY